MNAANDSLRVNGVGRDASDPRTLVIYFNERPSDDDLRRIHELLRDGAASPAAAADCKLVTYKPTPEMIDAGQAAERFGVAQVWREMLAASPVAPAGAPRLPFALEGERRRLDANELERIAKERPDDFFLKGSGVLKLIGGIRQLEQELRELKADPAGAPTEEHIGAIAAEVFPGYHPNTSFGRKCIKFARALLSAGSQGEQHDSSHEAAPQSSVASPAPRSSLRASDRSVLPREPL